MLLQRRMFLFEGISIPQTVCVAHFLLPIPLIFEFLGDPVTNPLSSSNFYPFGPSERWVQPPMEFLPSKRSRSCILSPMQPPRAPLHLLHAVTGVSILDFHVWAQISLPSVGELVSQDYILGRYG
ncbi:hypothetical protein ERO13_A08G087224v2 [Gossypium hirsutum]|uniref:Uncharacterized protein n=1 Tax=Gossypium tomentosum TaxID=34277 RepID=A0A5D2PCL9_GOSTO|nr:hypothetical protein ERO13_A08G087224v2 [Gossypium hirsutum]TYI14121.1 hypothetical protein ES332_A08G103700v1 [Gossypium tomentosum]